MESLGGGVQWRSNDVGRVVIFDFVNVGAEAGSEQYENDSMKTSTMIHNSILIFDII